MKEKSLVRSWIRDTIRNGVRYYSVVDAIARYKNPEEPKYLVKNWLRSKNTIEFLGLWEKLHNPGFKGAEFDSFMYQAGSNSFVLSLSIHVSILY